MTGYEGANALGGIIRQLAGLATGQSADEDKWRAAERMAKLGADPSAVFTPDVMKAGERANVNPILGGLGRLGADKIPLLGKAFETPQVFPRGADGEPLPLPEDPTHAKARSAMGDRRALVTAAKKLAAARAQGITNLADIADLDDTELTALSSEQGQRLAQQRGFYTAPQDPTKGMTKTRLQILSANGDQDATRALEAIQRQELQAQEGKLEASDRFAQRREGRAEKRWTYHQKEIERIRQGGKAADLTRRKLKLEADRHDKDLGRIEAERRGLAEKAAGMSVAGRARVRVKTTQLETQAAELKAKRDEALEAMNWDPMGETAPSTGTAADNYAAERAQLQPGEVLVQDEQGNVGAATEEEVTKNPGLKRL